MTVKIEKPAFNLRDKLSQIDRPVGNLGSEVLKTDTIDELYHNLSLSSGRRNLIINGNFQIWQRGTTFSNQNTTGYRADRWKVYGAGGTTTTITRESFNIGQTDVPGAPEYFMRVNNTPDSDTTWMEIEQKVEDVKRFSGRWITISFWIRSNYPQFRNDRLQVETNNGTSGSSSFTVGSTKFNISTAWERKVFTYYVPSMAGYTINPNNYLDIKTLQTAATGADTYYDIANFQLEYGRQATPFEYRSYAEELALCQRYYLKVPANSASYLPCTNASDHSRLHLMFPVTMRVAPTATMSNYTLTATTHGVNGYRNGANTDVQYEGTFDAEI